MSYAIVKKIKDEPVLYSIQKDIRTGQLEIYETYGTAKRILIMLDNDSMEIIEVIITRNKEADLK